MSNADEVRRMLEAPDDRDYTRYPDKAYERVFGFKRGEENG